MTFPDAELVERVDELGSVAWTMTMLRHTSRGRDPLSGDGARRFGGRWNCPGRSTVYLANPIQTCVAEFDRMAVAAGATPAALLPRDLHTVDVETLPVLDLTARGALTHVGLELEDISDDDWTACQAVGEAAHFLDFSGVVAPSSTGEGVVLAAFEDRIAAGQLEVIETTVLDLDLHRRLSGV